MRKNLTPFYPEDRSVGRVKSAIYEFFKSELKMDDVENWANIVKITLSDKNAQHIINVLNMTKEEYQKQVSERMPELVFVKDWNVPKSITYGQNYRLDEKKLSVMQPYYTSGESKPERAFIELLEKSDKIEWWFRNGDREATYFAVPYAEENGILKPFYIDFIVKFKDGSIGLFDTKTGFTRKVAGPKIEGLYQSSGQIPATSYTDLTVSFNTQGLALGVYQCTLRITNNDPQNPVVNVPVKLTVLGATISITPQEFNITLNYPQSKDTTLVISNLGNAQLVWNLTTVPQVNWLSVNPTSGNIPASHNQELTLSFTTTNLQHGTYNCTLKITSNDPANAVVNIPVRLTVLMPEISVVPTSIQLALPYGAVKDTVVKITNNGNTVLTWSLTEVPIVDWLSVTPTSGQIPATSYTDLTVSFNTQGLALGAYQCTLRITSNDPQNSVVDVPIQLTVLSGTQRPQISVIPSSITVVLDKNVIRDTSLTITNIGNATLVWNLQKTPDVSWLQVTPISGELLPSNSNNLNVRFITSNLLSWSYQCTLRITSNDPVTPTLDVLVTLIIPGWVRKNDVPSRMLHKLRFVRNGGALVCVGDSLIYAFRGNNSNEFYAYSIAKDSWLTKESIPFGRDSNDTTKISKKKIGKGAALCYDGDSLIYAIRGNNTKQFWKYNIIRNTWSALPFVPVTRGLKGGSGLCYHNGKVYLLAGGQKAVNKNFFVFDVQSATWDTLNSVPLTPDAKTFRDGSGIANINNTIYCLKGNGRHNYFLAYDINQNRWTQKETIPLRHPMLGDKRNRKNKVKDGGAITAGDGIVYIIKGGGKQDFWGYIPATESWIPLDTIPRLPESKKSVPKAGANLTFGYGKVWLIKGNNTFEFWSYTPAI
ncbi:MAG: hypothetical protein NZ601_03645, partial [candidate division WOR-3 bacterium]|nr:hypothetical protein [candidate division WOR-3 bacterium]